MGEGKLKVKGKGIRVVFKLKLKFIVRVGEGLVSS
jgi:hypothetical protein